VILAEQSSDSVAYSGLEEALSATDVQVLLFGKPDARPHRRMGVALATGTSLEEARNRADAAAAAIRVLPGG
jgi:phosphoribosylglycinamide formyltransferase 2